MGDSGLRPDTGIVSAHSAIELLSTKYTGPSSDVKLQLSVNNGNLYKTRSEAPW